jgi:AcrR family transcriptional regulator
MRSAEQGRRRYDSSGRRLQAQRNRERVLVVATRLFVDQGYAATSMARVAAEAGVSSRTVFAAFESKVNLLKEVLDTAVVGDSAELPLHERPAMRAVHAAPTAQEAVERLADAFASVVERVYDVYAVVHGAAAVDPEIAALERALEAQRLAGAAMLAATLADRFGITDPAGIDYVRDAVWTVGSPLQYGLLVRGRGWTLSQYRDWTARALAALSRPVPD